jgi:hypothetical protein
MLDPPVGVDGNSIARGAWRTDPADVQTLVDVTGGYAAATALIDNYRRLTGTAVPVIDQFGTTWPDVVVIEVSAIPSATHVAGTYTVRAAWTLLPSTSSPLTSTSL